MPKGQRIDWKPMADFINLNYHGITYKDLAELVNTEFGTSITAKAMSSYMKRHGLSSGIDGRFKKGHQPFNKGRKGQCAAGCEKSWFKKGHRPADWKPVGSEVRRSDGYLWRKVAEPNKWRMVHKIIYEENFGEIPKGYNVTFLDGNPENLSPANLGLISKAANAIRNRYLSSKTTPDELRPALVPLAELIIVANKLKKRRR